MPIPAATFLKKNSRQPPNLSPSLIKTRTANSIPKKPASSYQNKVKASAAVAPKAEATALLQEEGLVAKQFHDKDRGLYASGSFFVSDPPETKLTSIDPPKSPNVTPPKSGSRILRTSGAPPRDNAVSASISRAAWKPAPRSRTQPWPKVF